MARRVLTNRAIFAILAIILPIAISTNVVAKVRVGAKVGYGHFWLKENSTYGPSLRSSVGENYISLSGLEARSEATFGGYVAFSFNRFFSIQPEVIFNPKGGKGIVADTLGHRSPADISLNYLEVPVLVKGAINLTPRIRTQFFAGPGLAFPLDPKVCASEELWADDSSHTISNLNNPDITVTVGLGIELQMNRSVLSIELRTSFSQAPEKDLTYPISSSIHPGEVALLGLDQSPPRTVMVMMGYGIDL